MALAFGFPRTQTATMEQKESAHFTQEKEGEAVTLKIRFAQFKEAVGTKEERSCECIKWFNIVLSVLLLVMGLVCMIMGIVCHSKYYYQFKYIGEGYVNVVTVFIVSGIVMIIAGACGIFCIVKKSYCALVFCLIILAVLLIFHFVLGGFAFAYRSRADHMTEKALIRGYHKYFRDMGSQEFMDWSQKKFKCCGFTGPKDYEAGNKTHSSTKSPLTTTEKKTTTTPMPFTTTTAPTTTEGNNTTTAQVTNATTVVTTTESQLTTTNFTTLSPTKNSTLPPTTSTKPPTTTTKPSTTTTKPPTTTTEPPTTTTKPPTTTTKPPTTTSKPPTTTTKPPTTTTQPPATTQTSTTPTTKATTTMTKNIVNAAGDSLNLQSQGELPESCCQETKLAVPCINRPYDIYKRGCGEKLSCFLKKIMCAIGSIAFVMIFFDLLQLITAALCSKKIKEEATYTKF